MPCTTILVGKNASYDGSTLMARNEDSGTGHFCAKKFVAVKKEDQPRHYKSVISGVELDLPDNPVNYTAMPNAVNDEGIWGEAGINEYNVAMSETETLTSNPRVLGADPLVKEGIGEEDMLTIVLPYIRTAREGVERLGALLEQYGTYEMNGIGFQDVNEIWWLESVGGHHWIAKRVPDDAYVVMPNQMGIDFFDFRDAFGKKREHLCSSDLMEFVTENHLDLDMEPEELASATEFDARAAFGSHSDSDHVYNTPRAWYMLRYFNPTTCVWDGEEADYGPEDDDLPWCMVPEKKITPEDIKYILSSYYQGTPYNPYGSHMEPTQKGKYRPIGVNRNNFVAITQLRPYKSAEIMGLEWIAVGSNAFNEMVPMYANVERTPAYLGQTDGTVTTESFYWANRLIAALCDPHFSGTVQEVERYQLKLASLGHAFVKKTDRAFENEKPADVRAFLAEANDAMAAIAREETDKLLDKALFHASMGMKNAFSRADG